eukprot:7175778-Pyramimonas_sp.AAC.1
MATAHLASVRVLALAERSHVESTRCVSAQLPCSSSLNTASAARGVTLRFQVQTAFYGVIPCVQACVHAKRLLSSAVNFVNWSNVGASSDTSSVHVGSSQRGASAVIQGEVLPAVRGRVCVWIRC